jgi:hypothetical protein
LEPKEFRQSGERERLLESAGGIPKKAVSQSAGEGVISKRKRFAILDEM